jgi:hypothetical protein
MDLLQFITPASSQLPEMITYLAKTAKAPDIEEFLENSYETRRSYFESL